MELCKFREAKRIRRQISDIEDALKEWEAVKVGSDLGHKQHWNNGHLVPLPCDHLPEEIFSAFKTGAINALRAKREDLAAIFEAF